MSKSAAKILDTAESLFNQHSFVAVGVDLIRDQSGCSKTTMYTYFKNKQQLISEVLKQRDQYFISSLSTAIAESTGIQALERIYDWHMQWFQQDHFKGCLFIRAVAESNAEALEIRQIAQAHKQSLKQLIDQSCQSFTASSEIAQLSFLILEGLINQFLVNHYTDQAAMDSKKLLFKSIALLEMKAKTEV